MSDVVLRLDGVSRVFGETRAVDELSLEVNAGEVFTLLGPSGCGKTTTLRLIAGLERPDGGDIWLGDRAVASVSNKVFVPPHQRRMGMVFQSYAIWPHMNVFQNVSYPLRIRKVNKSEQKDRVARALNLVGLDGLESRPAPLLSGGQQQRVALARALVYEPEVLLLDEPFSNLDAKLREQMRVEVKLLQQRLGITVVFVTHDQTEALSLSSRIAVMELGKAVQIGEPKVLYESPDAPFVRDFLGKLFTLNGTVKAIRDTGDIEVAVEGQSGTVTAPQGLLEGLAEGDDVVLAIRPEDVVAMDEPDGRPNCVEGKIDALLFVGDRYECYLDMGRAPVMIALPRETTRQQGDTVTLNVPTEVISIWRE
jgi:ABC-type Fe3+/spermidine/putrescine transport system ATPase subunit